MITHILNKLIVAVIILILIFLSAIIVLSLFEEEENIVGLQEITGSTITFEVTHKGQYIPQHLSIRRHEKYDQKVLDYLDRIQESRKKTFLR